MNEQEYWLEVETAAGHMADNEYPPEMVEDIIWDDRQWLADYGTEELAQMIKHSNALIPENKPDWSLYKVASKMFCEDVQEYYTEHLWGEIDG